MINKIIGDYTELLELAIHNLKTVGISIESMEIDHIGYRAKSLADYKKCIKYLENNDVAMTLREVIIRNRPICVMKFKLPFIYKNYHVPCIEILSPAKGDRKFKRNLEHLEVVINDIRLTNFTKKYPKVVFNTFNLNNPINPELILNFPNDANVKFHQKPIYEIIDLL